MKPVVIDNPIINSPFEEPKRHHEFDADRNPTGKIVDGRVSICENYPKYVGEAQT